MSGFAGIFHTDGRPVDERALTRMLDSLAYRGPDAKGIQVQRSIGIGHRMLWTTPESLHEVQPLSNQAGDLWLIADARVDNRDELCKELKDRGAKIRTDTDAELILQSYETWGEDCPSKIVGDFAFAIWDSRAQKLFCARDPIGIKPFYYHFDGKTFRWASTPRAILTSPDVPTEANLRTICRILLSRFEDREETLYRGVMRIAPGHTLRISRDGIAQKSFWELDPSLEIRYSTDEEYVEHFLELFRTAVNSRLRSHRPVGCLLSGGLDSSAITCMAEKIYGEREAPRSKLQALSIMFDQMSCDERQFIDTVVQKLNIPSSRFEYQEHSQWLNFETVVGYPGIYYLPTLLMVGPAFAHARELGIRALLAGNGGDEILSSTLAHLTDLTRRGQFRQLFRQLKDDSEMVGCSQWKLLRDYCLKPIVPKKLRSIGKATLLRRPDPPANDWRTDECFRIANVEKLGRADSAAQFRTVVQQKIATNLKQSSNLNFAMGCAETFASHFGIESRYPYFDIRLVRFMFSVPDEQRWFGGWQKTLLRNAMRGILPEEVRTRKTKAAFNPVFDHEFRERRATQAQEMIRSSVLGKSGIVHVERFRQLFEQFQEGKAPTRTWKACQHFIGLELFCRNELQLSGDAL